MGITTMKRPVNQLSYVRSEETIMPLKALIIDLFKSLKIHPVK